MSEKKLKFDNIRVNKKESHKSKQPINLDLVNVDQISDDGFKYFIGYKEGEIVKNLHSLYNYSFMKMEKKKIIPKFIQKSANTK